MRLSAIVFLSILLGGYPDFPSGYDLDHDTRLDVRAVYAPNHP